MPSRARAGATRRTAPAVGARRRILDRIKRDGAASVTELAAHLAISYEGARQHLRQLVDEGVLEPRAIRPVRPGAGRPEMRYGLSNAGDHLFPKHYDQLTVELIDAIGERLGDEALERVLAAFTERRARQWAPRLAGQPFGQRLSALKSIYGDDDPYMTVETGPGGIRLIERNCPFLNVASRRPALCSVTVSLLQRLLGVRVVREERFQSGHGRCVFRVLADRPLAPAGLGFQLESEPTETDS